MQISQLKRDNEALARVPTSEVLETPSVVTLELEQLKNKVNELTEVLSLNLFILTSQENKRKSLAIQALEREKSTDRQTLVERQQLITEINLKLEFEAGEKEKIIAQNKHLQASIQQLNTKIAKLDAELSESALKLSETSEKLHSEFQLQILHLENQWREKVALSTDAAKMVEEQTGYLKIENSVLQVIHDD